MIEGQEEPENKINSCIWNFAEKVGKDLVAENREKRLPDLAILSREAYELLLKDNLLIERNGGIYINHQVALEIKAYNADDLNKRVLDEIDGDVLNRILEEQRKYNISVTLFKKKRLFGIFKERYKTYNLSLRVMDLCIN